MGRDLKIVDDEFSFKVRVSGIMCIDEKILTVKIGDNEFYCLPGGHFEIGEDSKDALKRELKEELGYEIKPIKFIGVIENFFKEKNKIFHELGFYYIIEAININDVNLKNYTKIENDKGILKNLDFKWVDLKDFKNIEFYPEVLKEKFYNKDFDFTHYIIKNK